MTPECYCDSLRPKSHPGNSGPKVVGCSGGSVDKLDVLGAGEGAGAGAGEGAADSAEVG